MSLGLWTAIATIGTFVVLAAGTAVALIQLSHLLVKLKLMPERFPMEFGGGADAILKCWTNLADVIAIRRREAPNAYQNFEFLAVRARKWLDRFPSGTYPSNEPRMQLSDRWADELP